MRDFTESQPYVQHLLAEHHRLHQMLQTARHAIFQGKKNDAKSGKEIGLTLRRVRDELASHFAEEEQEGCMEEAISYCPKLAMEVGRIKTEHPRLLAELDGVIALAADSNTTVEDRIKFENRFEKLCHHLHIHEAAENELLRRGFGTNVNGDENVWLLEPLKVFGGDPIGPARENGDICRRSIRTLND